MNNFLDIYNKSELENRQKVSYFLQQVFAPVTFISGAVPTHVNHESEYVTRVDMWIHGPEDITNNLLSGLTEEEFNLLKNISSKIWDLTKNMRYQATPKVGLLRQIYQRRLINNFFPEAKTILEVGPGSGYLSLMLGMDNKKVFSMDITQGFYLWQNFLFSSFNLLKELVVDRENDKIDDNYITHVPWWKFIKFEKICNQIDLITVNHALCEMSSHSVRHLLLVASKVGRPKFFMESYGSFKYSHKRSDIPELFREFGYKETYNINDVHIFEYDNLRKNFNYNNLIKIILFIPFIRIIIRTIYKEFLTIGRLSKFIFDNITFRKKKNMVKNKYDYNEVKKYYKKLTGIDNYRTPDEEFWDDVCEPKIKGIKEKLAYTKFDVNI